MTPIEKFEKWFASPISHIERSSADAAFIVLGVSCSMFERFVKSRMCTEKDALGIRRMHWKQKNAFFYSFSPRILGMADEKLFDNFWQMYRVGIAHYFMPQKVEWDGKTWGHAISVDEGFKDLPEYFHDAYFGYVIRINPWRWTERVINLWRARPDLLDVLPKFPLAEVHAAEIPAGFDFF